MNNTQQEFLTATSILTFGGASTAVWVVSITARKILKRDWNIIPFVTAMVLSFCISAYVQPLSKLIDFLLALINGCLLFCSATGLNETASYALSPKRADKVMPQGALPIKWIETWFRKSSI